jgi:uncharacterized protein (TIGR03437 family)
MNKVLLCGLAALAANAWAAATVTITATPVSLSFTGQVGGALPGPQTLSVKSSSGTPQFSVDPIANPWLTVSPQSGTLPATLTVRVNPISLTANTYTSSITVEVVGVASPTTIPVTLVVSPQPSTLSLSATALTFTAVPSTPPAAQTVTLSTDLLPISFTVTSGAAWLTATTLKGNGAPDVVNPGEEYPIAISINPTALLALAPQTAPYVAKITIVASGPPVTVKSQNITVSLTVNSMIPTLTSVWPATPLPVNAGAQTITLYGTNFYSATVAMVKGMTTPLTTVIDKTSSTYLFATIPAALLTAPTTLQLYVSNPAPGGNSALLNVVVANAPAIAAITNGASYATGPVVAPDIATVSPGDLVTIFGTNIGPTLPATITITGGVVDTGLSNVSVTVDGKNAPMLYAGQNQVTIQVPYEVGLGAGKHVTLTNGSFGSANVTVTVAATAPGLFTADGSGSGQVAALNYNSTTKQYTLNSSTSLAAVGDTVILYLTGEGVYDSAPLLGGASDTGFIVPDNPPSLPAMATLPTVNIGGVDASAGVAYAGPVPGSIMGLLQINVTVPTGSSTGVAVPVVVTIGGVKTQAGTTIAVHP